MNFLNEVCIATPGGVLRSGASDGALVRAEDPGCGPCLFGPPRRGDRISPEATGTTSGIQHTNGSSTPDRRSFRRTRGSSRSRLIVVNRVPGGDGLLLLASSIRHGRAGERSHLHRHPCLRGWGSHDSHPHGPEGRRPRASARYLGARAQGPSRSLYDIPRLQQPSGHPDPVPAGARSSRSPASTTC